MNVLPRTVYASLLATLLSCAAGLAAATERLSERWDERRAALLLERAAAHLQSRGEAALGDFARQGEFVDRDLYVYVLDTEGRFLASGGSSSALIGQDVSTRTDSAGKPFFRDMLDLARSAGSGRIDYRWLNPVSNRDEPKVALFRRIGSYIVAVGFYSPRATAAQARELLERAALALGADTDGALAAFQELDGGYMQDDLYVFVVDLEDGRFLANGASPALRGRDGRELRDPRGKAVISDMIAIARSRGHGQLEYLWRNPLTAKMESKTSFFRRVDGMLVGVGYYTR